MHLQFTLTSIIVLGLVVYLAIKLYEPPTCFDGKRNRDELGIDCGGTCALYCASQAQPLRVVWTKAFEVSPGWWSALSYVENPNADKYSDYIPYRMKLLDAAGETIVERTGIANTNSEVRIPIFEGRLALEGKKPASASLELLGEPRWYKPRAVYRLTTEGQTLTQVGLGGELQVAVRNEEPVVLRDVYVTSILYDAQGNAVAVSQTYLDMLGPRARRQVSFSWPQMDVTAISRIEFVPRASSLP
jgi:hypothetical protein